MEKNQTKSIPKKARAASALGATVTTRTMVKVSIKTLGLDMVNNVEISLAPSSLSLSLSHTHILLEASSCEWESGDGFIGFKF